MLKKKNKNLIKFIIKKKKNFVLKSIIHNYKNTSIQKNFFKLKLNRNKNKNKKICFLSSKQKQIKKIFTKNILNNFSILKPLFNYSNK